MFKRVLDLVGGLVAMVFLAPILLACAIAVKMSSPGPVIFRQKRLGLKGQEFEILKFRTMVQQAEHMGTGLFSYEGDPRITRVGGVLRKCSLDELPQIFNVLGGSMSLVGPRPPVTYELGPWEHYTFDMRRRFDVKPGITGLAQVSGRNKLDWDTKISLDNTYVDAFERWGVWVDIQILVRTIMVVLTGRDSIEVAPEGKEGPVTKRARQVMEKR